MAGASNESCLYHQKIDADVGVGRLDNPTPAMAVNPSCRYRILSPLLKGITMDDREKLLAAINSWEREGYFMTEEEHKAQHINFHKLLDANVAEFITMTRNPPSKTTLLEFMSWSSNMIDEAKKLGQNSCR